MHNTLGARGFFMCDFRTSLLVLSAFTQSLSISQTRSKKKTSQGRIRTKDAMSMNVMN